MCESTAAIYYCMYIVFHAWTVEPPFHAVVHLKLVKVVCPHRVVRKIQKASQPYLRHRYLISAIYGSGLDDNIVFVNLIHGHLGAYTIRGMSTVEISCLMLRKCFDCRGCLHFQRVVVLNIMS